MDQQINLGLSGNSQSPNGDAIYTIDPCDEIEFRSDEPHGYTRHQIYDDDPFHTYVDLNLAGIGSVDLSRPDASLEIDIRYYQDPLTNSDPYNESNVEMRIYTYEDDGDTYKGRRYFGSIYAAQNDDWAHIIVPLASGVNDGGIFEPNNVSRIRFYGNNPYGGGDDYLDYKNLTINPGWIPLIPVGWGDNTLNQIDIPAGNDFVALVAGDYHNLALKYDGSLTAWGNNQDGCNQVPQGNDFFDVAAGNYYSIALRTDGTLAGWGRDNYGQATVPAGNDYSALAAGHEHALALKYNGSVVGWGRNDYGQADDPCGSCYTAVAAGNQFSLALKSDGTIISWGHDPCNLPSADNFIAIAAGYEHALALTEGGSIVGWGSNQYQQIDVPPGSDFIAIAAGAYHSLALQADGSVVVWGRNNHGQTNVPEGNNFKLLAGGHDHSLALFQCPLSADLTADCRVDPDDLQMLSAQWLASDVFVNCPLTADLADDDCHITLADLAVLTRQWLLCAHPLDCSP